MYPTKHVMIWVVLVVVVGCASSQPPSSSQTTVSHNGEWYMEEGINAFARDDFDQSIMLWGKATTLMPRNARLANFIGLAHLRRGHDGKASLAFENAIEFDTGLAEAYNNRGIILVELKQLEAALESYESAIKINPDEKFLSKLNEIVSSSKSKVKALILNYPNNPTTTFASLDFFGEVVKICKKYEVYILSDIAYAEIYFNTPPPSILQVKAAKGIAVEFSSLS